MENVVIISSADTPAEYQKAQGRLEDALKALNSLTRHSASLGEKHPQIKETLASLIVNLETITLKVTLIQALPVITTSIVEDVMEMTNKCIVLFNGLLDQCAAEAITKHFIDKAMKK